MREVRVFGTEREIAAFFIERFRRHAAQALAKRAYWTLALCGGMTPVRIYRLIVASAAALPWSQAHIFMGDERHVSFRSARSNFGMVRKELLSRLPVPESHLHPVPIRQTPAGSARAYERELRAFFLRRGRARPSFDVMVLGIGEDGHTAALFPADAALKERRRWAVPVYYPFVQNKRVTLTVPVINSARHIYMLATGERKSGIIPGVIAREAGFPVSLIRPRAGTLTFVLDKKAAAALP